ncbi:MAG: hypothetical protein ACKVU1_00400 [bacterium]
MNFREEYELHSHESGRLRALAFAAFVVCVAMVVPGTAFGGDLRGRVRLPAAMSAGVALPNPYPGVVTSSADGGARSAARLNADDAVISLVPVAGTPRPRAKRTIRAAELRQKNQAFAPRVLAVPVGATVSFPNDDPFYHNVFSYSAAKRFDLGRYGSGKSKDLTFDKPGLVKVFCEIHSDMVGYIAVLESDLFTMPARDGAYDIAGLAAGEYEVKVWHPDLSEWSSRVAIPESGAATLDIDLR